MPGFGREWGRAVPSVQLLVELFAVRLAAGTGSWSVDLFGKMHVFVCFWGCLSRLTRLDEAETCSPNQIPGQAFCTNPGEPQLTVFIQGGNSQKIVFKRSD